ncbi:hypothetical protein BV25DRAFT_1804497 [Artomyces pyxidatus]|uniref:Uncharacterized protein n=1 Tax=Artomyces pyxidatus TaxID=48021 RepID=A0ACB8SZY4_9AGAM|nr:hypothetical protein BV25DRAFT_1804497 [Artomyces pyxidatus]
MSAAVAAGSSSHKEKRSKTKDKQDKSHKNKTSRQEEHGRKEGADVSTLNAISTAYKPPEGSVPAEYDVEFGEFDYDTVKADDEAELWLVRVPDTLKQKYLENAHILVPSTSRAGRVGTVSQKHSTYDVWSLSRDGSSGTAGVGAEELDALSVLLPRAKKGGKLYLAPKPITRHLVVAAPPARPSGPEPDDASPGHLIYQNPPRHAYPAQLLTHRFRPYGDTSDKPTENSMEVDEDGTAITLGKDGGMAAQDEQVAGQKVAGKKRKGDNESPKVKKVKKAKTTT